MKIQKLKVDTTTHLNSSSANRKRLEEAIRRDKKGNFETHNLIENIE